MMFESKGILRYSKEPLLKVVLEVDPDIALYYRAMLPKWVRTNPQRYAPHISVVRHETPPNMNVWGKYEGQEVDFAYDNEVHSGKVYFWLNAFSHKLEDIRGELGLPLSSKYTMPPEGFVKCFHITLANQKELEQNVSKKI